MQGLTVRIIVVVFVLFGFNHPGFSEIPSASQIEREQEVLEREKGAENKLKKGQKVFIKEVTVRGANSLGKEQINALVSEYQGHWFSPGEIEDVRERIKGDYEKKGFENQPAKISFRIEKGHLWIDVEELKQRDDTH